MNTTIAQQRAEISQRKDALMQMLRGIIEDSNALMQSVYQELGLLTTTEAHLQTDVAFNAALVAVCLEWGVPAGRVISKGRVSEFVVPRHVLMWLMRRTTDLSMESIGQMVGGRDHTSVLNGCRSVQNRIDTEPDFAARVQKVLEMLWNDQGPMTKDQGPRTKDQCTEAQS